jgi:hypothetical protein
METAEPKKHSRKLAFVYILYGVLSLLMLAGVMYMAKYMDQS